MTAPTLDKTMTTWTLDPAHTLVEFAAKHMMITTVKGRFADVEGTLHIDDAHPTKSSADVTIKTASIDTRTDQRDTHLKSADFLEADKFPVIRFTSTNVEPLGGERLRVTGDLTIRNVTKPVVLDVTHEGRSKDPWGGDRVGFSARTKIDRRDFGLVWNQALETGGVLVSNEIRISLEVEAVKTVA